MEEQELEPGMTVRISDESPINAGKAGLVMGMIGAGSVAHWMVFCFEADEMEYMAWPYPACMLRPMSPAELAELAERNMGKLAVIIRGKRARPLPPLMRPVDWGAYAREHTN